MIPADLVLPDACPCCGAGVKREVLEQENGGPTLTRTYGHPQNAHRCGAALTTHAARQAAGEAPFVVAGCKEALSKLLGGEPRSAGAVAPADVDGTRRRVMAAARAA